LARTRAGIYVTTVAALVVLAGLLPAGTSAATSVTLTPVADAHVAVASPTNNYGSTNPLRTREGAGTSTDPTYRAYLKFDVSGLAGKTIQSVTLRLFVPSDPTPNVQNVFRVTDSTWAENTINFNNGPAPEASPVGASAAPVTGYNDIPLSAGAITSSTLQTFFIKSAGNNNLAFSSREDATNKPQLVVVFDDPTPTPTPTDTPTPTPTDTATPTPTDTATPTPPKPEYKPEYPDAPVEGIYVSDRGGKRVQVFRLDGTYVTQVFIGRECKAPDCGNGTTAASTAFSTDPEQRFLYVGNRSQARVMVFERRGLELLDSFGEWGSAPGQFGTLHHMAADSKGNLYVTEVTPLRPENRRVQKFILQP